MAADEASISDVEDKAARHIFKDHEKRLMVMERAGLLVGGYLIAEGQSLAQAIFGLV